MSTIQNFFYLWNIRFEEYIFHWYLSFYDTPFYSFTLDWRKLLKPQNEESCNYQLNVPFQELYMTAKSHRLSKWTRKNFNIDLWKNSLLEHLVSAFNPQAMKPLRLPWKHYYLGSHQVNSGQ